MNPDKTAPQGVVWSGSILFAKKTIKDERVDNKQLL